MNIKRIINAFSSITLSENAASSVTDDTIGFSTPSGSYLVTSASFVDPQNKLSVLDITGSVTGSPSSSFAVLAQAKSNNATVTNGLGVGQETRLNNYDKSYYSLVHDNGIVHQTIITSN